MKKVCYLLIITFSMLQSCSSGENNAATEEIPLSPTELTSSLTSITQATLNWTDNSTNETGFKIERKSRNENYATIGTVGSDVTIYEDNDLLPDATYTYRVLAYNKAGNSITYTNQVAITTPAPITIPTVQTFDISASATWAVSGGNISSDGGSAIISRGVVWNTSPNPTIVLTTKTPSGTGIGDFMCETGSLKQNTTYYLRAYATNSIGTSYGNEISFITPQLPYSFAKGSNVSDIDGNTYPTIITSCDQKFWMQQNLNVSHYRNGDVIPQVTDPAQWANLTTGAWCYYANDTQYGFVYGKMYNWYAVNDPRGLAPQGWHIPTDAEWWVLTDCLGGTEIAGGKMKETGITHWSSPNTGATNSSGFTALPGGQRNYFGNFETIQVASWWSSNGTGNFGIHRSVLYDGINVINSGLGKATGIYVRCVKD